MEVYTKLADLKRKYPRLVVALGMFDGVHLGHQSIIRRAVDLARKADGKCLVYTFSNHPLSVLAPEKMPEQIGSNLLRQERLAALGVDILMSVPFTKDFSQISPEDFLLLLQAHFAPRYVVTGANYTFGERGRGTQRLLKRAGSDYDFVAEICPTVEMEGSAVSSTRIRNLLREGNLAAANGFLGYPFTIIERVRHGNRRGRKLGFPTANIALGSKRAMLPCGVYAAEARYAGKHYAALANIGSNPTFDGQEIRLEVNIQDFDQEIYDQLLAVSFYEKIREERKFASAELLVKQMHRDREKAKTVWRKYQT